MTDRFHESRQTIEARGANGFLERYELREMPDLYSILGVPQLSTVDHIIQAYAFRVGSMPMEPARRSRMLWACRILANSQFRSLYDRFLAEKSSLHLLLEKVSQSPSVLSTTYQSIIRVQDLATTTTTRRISPTALHSHISPIAAAASVLSDKEIELRRRIDTVLESLRNVCDVISSYRFPIFVSDDAKRTLFLARTMRNNLDWRIAQAGTFPNDPMQSDCNYINSAAA